MKESNMHPQAELGDDENRRLKNMFKEQIVEFCEMKLEEFNIFSKVDTNSKNTDKILDKIH